MRESSLCHGKSADETGRSETLHTGLIQTLDYDFLATNLSKAEKDLGRTAAYQS